MNYTKILSILKKVESGTLTVSLAQEQLMEILRDIPFEDLGFARVDHHRIIRQGLPEVIFGLGKTPEQVAIIAERLVKAEQPLLVTRTNELAYSMVQKVVPDAKFHIQARAITRQTETSISGQGTILITSAGTSDLPVAEEARVSAELFGNQVDTLYDVGVAGLHRVLAERKRLDSARVIIVVAGMEGALSSVVGGLVRVPVIAVPTSIGYGTSFGGLTALLGMLNSCAPGVSVVNIDNGFGAAAMASTINHLS